MLPSLESDALMAAIDWHGSRWRRTERGAVGRLAQLAGYAAYVSPHWSNRLIQAEAARFFEQSVLLAPQQDNATLRGIVYSQFLRGWRAHEADEQRGHP